MGAALVLMLVGFGAMAAGVLIGRYYVPDEIRRKLKGQQSLQVQVSIAPWGQARISRVEVLPAPRRPTAP